MQKQKGLVRNMQKQKLRNNKIKGRNTKNMPMFILIGLIAMIIIIAVIYYVFLRYSPEQIITYSGYAIEGKTMAENLKSDGSGEIEQYLNLIEIKENDLLYKRLNSYYIGEDDKKEVDINYPMYINEGNTIFNISRNTKLITVNYEEVEGYPEFMLTGGVMYNGGDLTRADGNQYLFIKSEDDIYTNVQKINIQKYGTEVKNLFLRDEKGKNHYLIVAKNDTKIDLKSLKDKIHPAMKGAFEKLYGYTSDANGIRHANGLGEGDSTFEEAKYMLISCSAFVNYLKENFEKDK